jgi:hypothetical protein
MFNFVGAELLLALFAEYLPSFHQFHDEIYTVLSFINTFKFCETIAIERSKNLNFIYESV